MKALIESAARKAGIPPEVLDLFGREWLSQVIDDLPELLLPPVIYTMKHEYMEKGLDWMRQNLISLQSHFLMLRQMYANGGM